MIQYDDGPVAVLQEIPDFELYISQNSSQAIWRRRQIRMSLRALDGQTVRWPYQHVQVNEDLRLSLASMAETLTHSADRFLLPMVFRKPTVQRGYIGFLRVLCVTH